jgi:hypothetical protein
MSKYRITLDEDEREALLAIVTKGTGTAARIKHANILLAVDRGNTATLCMTDEQAAGVYHAAPKTVYNVKRAFVEEGLDAALGRKTRECPPRIVIDGEAEAKIVALTCQDPPDGYSQWSLRLIADTVVRLGILPAISHVAIGTLLKKTSLSHGYIRSGASPNSPAST